jgi:AcrR family transcriptional regulator
MSRTVQNHRFDRERGRGAGKRPIDRRVARTRATLHHALISLILQKDYDAITIEEICETANVGRSTFYAHYTDKDHLHRHGIENLRSVLAEQRKDDLAGSSTVEARRLSFSRTFFEHAQDRRDLFRALAGSRGGAVAFSTIRQIICEAVRDELATIAGRGPTDSIPREVIVQYIVGAFMAVLTWWLDQGAKLPAQRVDAMFQHLAFEGVAASR